MVLAMPEQKILTFKLETGVSVSLLFLSLINGLGPWSKFSDTVELLLFSWFGTQTPDCVCTVKVGRILGETQSKCSHLYYFSFSLRTRWNTILKSKAQGKLPSLELIMWQVSWSPPSLPSWVNYILPFLFLSVVKFKLQNYSYFNRPYLWKAKFIPKSLNRKPHIWLNFQLLTNEHMLMSSNTYFTYLQIVIHPTQTYLTIYFFNFLSALHISKFKVFFF